MVKRKGQKDGQW